MSCSENKKCYICDKPLDDVNNYVIRFDDEAFDLCEQHYQTSKRLLAHIDKRKKELEGKICCKNEVSNIKIDIDSAIKYLHEQYDKALKMDYIKNPLAWALYQTWRYVDKGNGVRR